MRTLLALALALVACGGSDRDDALPRDARPSPTPRGPDPIVMRVPRAGGPATASVYPRLDSVVWTSQARLPALARVLAVNPDQGLLAFVGRDSVPGRLDLRTGAVARASGTKLRELESADAEAIFGVAADGKVVRLTPTGEPWSLTPPRPARAVLPQPDGWLLVVADSADRTIVWRLRPPERRLVDTLALPRGTEGAIRTRVGDRVYFASAGHLTGVRTAGLEPLPGHDFDAPVSALATTPSGDRVFVLTDSSPVLAVVDRYQERVTSRVELPGVARGLRVDPLGRFLLVRPANGDSAWVVSVSDGDLLGTVRSSWRTDLPFVAPDGRVAAVRGKDVVFVDPRTLDETGRVAGGAADHWIQFVWNGFRPRAEGLDDPVEFRTPPPPVEPEPLDTATVIAADSAPSPFQPADSARGGRPARPAPRPPAAEPAGFNVSFAALLDEGRARALAGEIEVGGQRARVAVGQRAGVPIYRVVLGPYPTRADADRVGQESGRQYFVIEGNP